MDLHHKSLLRHSPSSHSQALVVSQKQWQSVKCGQLAPLNMALVYRLLFGEGREIFDVCICQLIFLCEVQTLRPTSDLLCPDVISVMQTMRQRCCAG